jgi:hypothetical protein
MGVLAKMVVSEKTESWGAHYPPEHFDDDHWFTNMDAGKGQTCECVMIPDGVGSVAVELRPVYSTEPGHENHKFWSATPTGSLKMTINNPAASGQFEVGVEYYVEIRKARK